MNQHPLFAIAASISLWSTTLATAQFTGLDDFSGPSRNTAKWGDPFEEGTGLLSMSGDGVLRYSISGPTGPDDQMAWPWIVGNAPFNENWSIQADVNVPVKTLPAGNTANGIGVAVLHSADPDLNFSAMLENYRTSTTPQEHHFLSNFDFPGDMGSEVFHLTPATSAAVRISWDADTHTLTASFDENGATGGYVWTPFRTVDPTLPATWDMDETGAFQIAVVGFSEDTPVSLGDNVFADNFYVIGPSLPPIDIQRTAGQIKLAWSRLALDFNLKSSSTLLGEWSAVTAPVTLSGDEKVVCLPVEPGPPRFFRLEK